MAMTLTHHAVAPATSALNRCGLSEMAWVKFKRVGKGWEGVRRAGEEASLEERGA